MNSMEKLKDSMVRVKALVDFYQQSPNTTLDSMDSFTNVTIEDLETLLVSKLGPKFKTPLEIAKDVVEAKGYNKGYSIGYKAGMRRVKELIDRFITVGLEE